MRAVCPHRLANLIRLARHLPDGTTPPELLTPEDYLPSEPLLACKREFVNGEVLATAGAAFGSDLRPGR